MICPSGESFIWQEVHLVGISSTGDVQDTVWLCAVNEIAGRLFACRKTEKAGLLGAFGSQQSLP